eukprot:CAMPEP_0178376430 /NCGR_PEP_ID=MMETSP0689_2-20121128/3398_1 /TAXON_ID=160604 /ORGANISM="Amphidinium massartii, Strain CS-259" /LENGTH=355 /DNA_ID=CAMNT_0019996451 /DNA_START=304 /DNA_END=1368 /DNA_ORIENTATION=+
MEEDDGKAELQSFAVTLLNRLASGKGVEAAHAVADEDGTIDVAEFRQLLRRLRIDCEESDAETLFRMVDSNSEGRVPVAELRNRLRESESIQDMYTSGLNGVLITLIPTVALGLAFAFLDSPEASLDFFTGYIIEDSLSVDNLFVFLVLFRYFQVPPKLQPFCLNVGIVGAVVLRGVFIFAGLAAVEAFQPILLLFSALLIGSAVQTLTADEDEDDESKDEPSPLVRDFVARLPMTDCYSGPELFVQDKQSGAWLATPLMLCIVAIELSDIVFAVDSIPAVFAVTQDPLIVFTSNIAAILGLRSLYNVLAIAMQDLVYLEKGVAIVLGFVGCKLAGQVAGFEVSSSASLAFIAVT